MDSIENLLVNHFETMYDRNELCIFKLSFSNAVSYTWSFDESFAIPKELAERLKEILIGVSVPMSEIDGKHSYIELNIKEENISLNCDKDSVINYLKINPFGSYTEHQILNVLLDEIRERLEYNEHLPSFKSLTEMKKFVMYMEELDSFKIIDFEK